MKLEELKELDLIQDFDTDKNFVFCKKCKNWKEAKITDYDFITEAKCRDCKEICLEM